MTHSPLPSGLRVALVHDFLNQRGGAEKLFEVFVEMFPDAPVYTSVYDAAVMPQFWRQVDIRTSFMQRISPRLRVAKALIPLYPTAFESFDLSGYDLVLSSTTAFAKGVITKPETCHICYCNSTTRFLWSYHDYLAFERLPPGALRFLPWLTTPLRVWDFAAAQRVDYFVASSRNTARRIAKYYRRDSEILHPCIDTQAFRPAPSIDDYYLVLSRLQPYKRIDLAVQACTRLGLSLHVVGDGPDRRRLESVAGPTVTFFGRVPEGTAKEQLSRCRALLFPGEEDFGLTPIEAQASGRPVIAYAGGGALETVRDGITGAFFHEQSVDALAGVLAGFDASQYEQSALRANAAHFDKSRFKECLTDMIVRRLAQQRRHLESAGTSTDVV